MHYNEGTGDYINDDFEVIPNTELMFDMPYIIDKEKYATILEKYKVSPRIKDANVVVFSAAHYKPEDDGFHFEKKTLFVFPKNSPEGSKDFYDCIQFGEWFEDEGRSLEVYTRFVNELMSCVCELSKEYCSILKADILDKIKTELSNIETIDKELITMNYFGIGKSTDAPDTLGSSSSFKKPCGDCCTDGRFEMIERVKNKLIEATNIETSDDEMKVIDNILFRFWQMDWLEMIDEKINKK